MTYPLLEGLRVLELGQFVSAPYCGKLLADMGAEVIKIEPPGAGEYSRRYGPFLHDDPHRERSGMFLYLNANKLGATLDLATPHRPEHLPPAGGPLRRVGAQPAPHGIGPVGVGL